jgi:hypothetical protein
VLYYIKNFIHVTAGGSSHVKIKRYKKRQQEKGSKNSQGEKTGKTGQKE